MTAVIRRMKIGEIKHAAGLFDRIKQCEGAIKRMADDHTRFATYDCRYRVYDGSSRPVDGDAALHAELRSVVARWLTAKRDALIAEYERLGAVYDRRDAE